MSSINLQYVFILIFFILVYYRLAKKYNIVDRPNHRSSHSEVTVRGGGIIFPIAVVMWWFVNDYIHTWMVIGIVWISTISLLDDLYTLSRKLRFGIQFMALSMAFYDLGLFEQQPYWSLPILYFIALGIINAINFMDGINGITGLYSLAFFGSLLVVNQYMPIFDESLIQFVIMGVSVFLIFNLRKKALMFAGDIGSISIAYLMIYFLTQWYLAGHAWTIVFMLLVYGADSFLTLGQRLVRGEKVTEPHRSHLYQLMANQLGWQHVLIALGFAIAQLGINYFLFIQNQGHPNSILGFVILFLAALIYLSIKLPIQKKFNC